MIGKEIICMERMFKFRELQEDGTCTTLRLQFSLQYYSLVKEHQ